MLPGSSWTARRSPWKTMRHSGGWCRWRAGQRDRRGGGGGRGDGAGGRPHGGGPPSGWVMAWGCTGRSWWTAFPRSGREPFEAREHHDVLLPSPGGWLHDGGGEGGSRGSAGSRHPGSVERGRVLRWRSRSGIGGAAVWDELAGEGLRVRALAVQVCQSRGNDPYTELEFLGLVGLMDPPREGVAEAVRACRDAGIRVGEWSQGIMP